MEASIKAHAFGQEIASDILQEYLGNDVAAWVNLLLMSCSGPVKNTVGACATAAESLSVAVNTILRGEAKAMICGGADDIAETTILDFGAMGATADTREDHARGRDPKEMSRPAATTRTGFLESHGAGIHLLMTADLALAMGCPIYGIVSHVSTAMDKQGRSLPAPGKGILSTAREVPRSFLSNSISLQYRRAQIIRDLRRMELFVDEELERVKVLARAEGAAQGPEYVSEMLRDLTTEVKHQHRRRQREILRYWGNEPFVDDEGVSPLRAALAVWGLSPNDIDVLSFHGTSTKANELNETAIIAKQLAHLKRSKGNRATTIFQKHLTGHPKGAAAAWMLTGALQILNTGHLPPNRNADNIDERFRDLDYLLFSNKRRRMKRPVRSINLKSFGFGQAGAEITLVHPMYALAVLYPSQRQQYQSLLKAREVATANVLEETMCGKRPLIPLKEAPPYDAATEEIVLLNPLARASWDSLSGSYRFHSRDIPAVSSPNQRSLCTYDFEQPFPTGTDSAASALTPALTLVPSAGALLASQLLATAQTTLTGNEETTNCGIGVDVEVVSTFRGAATSFLVSNFTKDEISYCGAAGDPAASFAGKWSAKEAVIKAVSNLHMRRGRVWVGAVAPLIDIEIVNAPSGAPEVVLHNVADEIVKRFGVREIKVSISHTSEYAVASAIAY